MPRSRTAWYLSPRLPLIVAVLGLIGGGLFLLHRSETQARDTIRKHHLQDIEDALYFAYNEHGTYPPYALPTWCGVLQAPGNSAVREEIEVALRQQNAKYANLDKPFPDDPRVRHPDGFTSTKPAEDFTGYFYWKRSPAVFELYSKLETDRTGDRSTIRCPSEPTAVFDYGINSRLRAGSLTL